MPHTLDHFCQRAMRVGYADSIWTPMGYIFLHYRWCFQVMHSQLQFSQVYKAHGVDCICLTDGTWAWIDGFGVPPAVCIVSNAPCLPASILFLHWAQVCLSLGRHKCILYTLVDLLPVLSVSQVSVLQRHHQHPQQHLHHSHRPDVPVSAARVLPLMLPREPIPRVCRLAAEQDVYPVSQVVPRFLFVTETFHLFVFSLTCVCDDARQSPSHVFFWQLPLSLGCTLSIHSALLFVSMRIVKTPYLAPSASSQEEICERCFSFFFWRAEGHHLNSTRLNVSTTNC